MKPCKDEIWIFLSHSNEDYEKVRKVRNILEEMNTRPLMFFLKCLDDTAEIEDLIKREIKARTRFVLCDSQNARKSNWVQKEIDYIKQLHKPYEVVDINADETTIKSSLKDAFRKEHIFISYPRELKEAADVIKDRLSKYDFCSTFIDVFDMAPGVNFMAIIEENIASAIRHGKFIPLLTHDSLPPKSRFSTYELQIALDLDKEKKAILPIYLDEEAKSFFQDKLSDYDCIDLSRSETPHQGFTTSKDIPHRHGSLKKLTLLGNDIVNAILVRLQGWGNIETYAEAFRFGISVGKDVKEADILGDLVVEHLEKVDYEDNFTGPGMLIRLGGLFRDGRVVKQDIEKARQYYIDARLDWGITIDHLLSSLNEG